MHLLKQARNLFSGPEQVTIATARQLQELQCQASGQEKQDIGQLWETFILNADDDAYNQAWEEELI